MKRAARRPCGRVRSSATASSARVAQTSRDCGVTTGNPVSGVVQPRRRDESEFASARATDQRPRHSARQEPRAGTRHGPHRAKFGTSPRRPAGRPAAIRRGTSHENVSGKRVALFVPSEPQTNGFGHATAGPTRTGPKALFDNSTQANASRRGCRLPRYGPHQPCGTPSAMALWLYRVPLLARSRCRIQRGGESGYRTGRVGGVWDCQRETHRYPLENTTNQGGQRCV